MQQSTNLVLRDIPRNELPWELLREADPSDANIDSYISDAIVFGLFDGARAVGIVAMAWQPEETMEVMNIAVAAEHRRRSIGTGLLASAIERARALGAKRLLVGTGNSSIGQLAFYQKAGFRMESIERDHFIRHYPEPIMEHGIQCRDMVRLSLDLVNAG